MIQEGKGRSNYFGSAVFTVLICLFLYVLSGNSAKHAGSDLPYKFVVESQSNAAAIVEIQQFHFQKSHVPFIDRSDLKSCNEGLKLIAVNHALHQRIFLLQRARLLVKPLLLQRFYNQYHSMDTDDLPALS